ncbi:MAG: hypothetical protein HYV65_02300, partial [Candidatus Spechtbacteria bacterium]|nr:hypothetical protein [Candidatus Spechtbacteria bacterium]
MVKKFKKYISPSSAAFVAFALLVISAGSALAAENVIFTQSQNITLSSTNDVIQILRSGTNISVDTVVINTANIVITIDDDDVVTLVNPDRKTLNATNTTGTTSSCGATDFRLVIPDQGATVSATVTVGSVCSSGGGGGGGGGGGSAPAATTPVVTPVVTPTPAAVPTTTTGEVTATATEGGKTTVTTTDSVVASVELPAAAVSASTTVSIAPEVVATATASRPVPAGQSVIGSNVYNYVASSGGTA